MDLSVRTICAQAKAGLIPGAYRPSAKTKNQRKGKGGTHWRFNRMIFFHWWEQQQNPGTTILRPMRRKRSNKNQLTQNQNV